MPANKRLFYAVMQAGFAKLGETSYTAIHGLQSIGVTTRFNLEQVFEIGQISLYENIENLPDVEVQLEKVLDGYPLAYHLATNGATSATLSGRSNIKSILGICYFTDTQDAASGTPLRQCNVSGVYPSQWQLNVPTEGNTTEQLTLVGNNKAWLSGSFTFTGAFNNTDAPIGTGGVQRREDIRFGNTSTSCRLPVEIPGISPSGYNERPAGGDYGAHIQSIRVSVNLGRENLFELGRRGPYHRFVNFPTEVRSEFECYCTEGDMVRADEDAESNVYNRTIILYFNEGTKVDLGNSNKLESSVQGGGNAGGGGSNNVTNTFSFVNFNDLTVTHPNDPSGL